MFSGFIDWPYYSWAKTGGQLPDNAVLKDFNRQLYIPNIQQIHSGDYECTVRVAFGGQASRAVSLLVEGSNKTSIYHRTSKAGLVVCIGARREVGGGNLGQYCCPTPGI